MATLPTLAAGATVIANDLEPLHLLGIRAKATPDQQVRLTLQPDRFPDNVVVTPNSRSAVHSSNLLHFLSVKDIQRGLSSIFDWLLPGGKLFVTTASPYQRYISQFIPIFEQRKAAGLP